MSGAQGVIETQKSDVETLVNDISLRPSMDILTSVNSLHKFSQRRDRSEIAALHKWVHFCSQRADDHQQKAKVLRAVNLGTSALSIVASSATAVLVTVGNEFATCGGAYGYVTSAVGAVSVVASAINALLDPSSRRKMHLLAENEFGVLGREMAVILATEEPHDHNIGSISNDFWKDLLLQYQRRLDTLITWAPPV